MKNTPTLDVEAYDIEKEHLSILTKEQAIKHCAIPLDNIDNIVTICVAEPSMDLIMALGTLTGKVVRLVKDDHRIINRRIQEVY